MPYKTKFREMELPKTPEEDAAIGSDANTLRSYGAAIYKDFGLKIKYPEKMLDIAKTFLGAQAAWESDLRVNGKAKKIPRSRRAHKYTMQGFMMGAQELGNTKVAEYVEQRLRELYGSNDGD